MCPFITIHHWTFSTYILLTHVAYLAFVGYFLYASKMDSIPRVPLSIFLVLFYFVQWIAGAILPAIHNWFQFGPFPLYQFLEKGRFFHSAFIFSLFYVMIFALTLKWPIRWFMDHFAIAASIMSAVGRIGCFMQGCCAGKETGVKWAMRFIGNPVHVHPTQIYHFVIEGFVLTPILLFLRKRKTFDGQVFWTYVFLYSVFRFIVEIFRDNQVAAAGLTHAQWFSLLMIPVAAAVLAVNFRRPDSKVSAPFKEKSHENRP